MHILETRCRNSGGGGGAEDGIPQAQACTLLQSRTDPWGMSNCRFELGLNRLSDMAGTIRDCC